MRIVLLLIAAGLLAGGCLSTHGPGQSPTADPVVSVEKQSSMSYVVSKKTGQRITPGIQIYADGTCRVRTDGGEEVRKSVQISRVRDLLDFFQREGLFSISDDSIDRHMKSVARFNRVVVVDSSWTRIAARQDSKEVRISRYALDAEIRYYPEVPELQTVRRCVERVYETAGTKP
jgi:hypothetical protein